MYTNEYGDTKDKFIFTENEVTKISDSFSVSLIGSPGVTTIEPINSTDYGTYYITNETIHFTWTNTNNMEYSDLLPIENSAKYVIKGNKLTMAFSWNNKTLTYEKIN